MDSRTKTVRDNVSGKWPLTYNHLRTKIGQKSLTQLFDDAMTSLSSDKDKTKN